MCLQGVFHKGKHRSAQSTPSCQTSTSNGVTTPASDQSSPEPMLEQKVLAAQVALKCADIGLPASTSLKPLLEPHGLTWDRTMQSRHEGASL